MEVLKVTAYYKTSHGLSVVNMAAACPIGEAQNSLIVRSAAISSVLLYCHCPNGRVSP